MSAPKAPSGLGPAGRKLWRDVLADFEVPPDGRALLIQACRTADELDALADALAAGPVMVEGSTGQPKVSGLFTELRQHRATLGKLLDQLALPDDEDDDVGKTPAQRQASEAAKERWRLEKEKRGYGTGTA